MIDLFMYKTIIYHLGVCSVQFSILLFYSHNPVYYFNYFLMFYQIALKSVSSPIRLFLWDEESIIIETKLITINSKYDNKDSNSNLTTKELLYPSVIYSLTLTLHEFYEMWRKVVENISKMLVSLLYIHFIINCE